MKEVMAIIRFNMMNVTNYVAKEAKEYKVAKALIISRGRGGINSALVVEKYPAL